jgi:Flp pilus assembly protein TadG
MSRSRESGQTLVVSIIFMVVLIGFVGLAVDGGNVLLQRRNMQGVADASAMAGVMEVSRSTTSANATARDYVTSKNASDNATIKNVVVTGAASSSCEGKTIPKYSVCVVVSRTQNASFAQIIGVKTTKAEAKAVASANQVYAMGKWLPIGLMDGAWTSGNQISFAPGSANAPAGTINPDAGDTCKFSGGNTVRDVAISKAFGGIDACALPIGSMIPTQTGGTNGPVLQGLTTRVGSNTDSFNDVFEWNAAMGKYVIKKPDSPRLGIVPIAEGGATWSLTGGASMKVVGYGIVYLGDVTKPNANPYPYPPVTGNGSTQKIAFTPVDAVMPATWDVELSGYDPNNHSPIIYRMVE